MQEVNLRSLMDAPLPTLEQVGEVLKIIMKAKGQPERDEWKTGSMATFLRIAMHSQFPNVEHASGLELGYYLGRYVYEQDMAEQAAEIIHEQMVAEGLTE